MMQTRATMYQKLKSAIDSGLFNAGLTKIVSPPTSDQIAARSKQLPLPFSQEHVQLLLEWGGSNLDVIRINGLQEITGDDRFIAFANDYDGFIYKYDQTGAVFSEDTDGAMNQKIALSIPVFINEVLLGEQCVGFYGSEWLEELRKFKLI